ncbi:hypothetical protein NKJ81_25490 [Mesorhizobium sp. M0018]|uniref:hypothetical protein n=1 Tax=Mesorhizobium sp. M0018 TaxID=2956844 RepID=UPI00333A2BD1
MDRQSDYSRAMALQNLASNYNFNAMTGNDAIEQCDDMNSPVDALKEAYGIFNACSQSFGVSTMGLIRVYNLSRSDYCAEAKKQTATTRKTQKTMNRRPITARS